MADFYGISMGLNQEKSAFHEAKIWRNSLPKQIMKLSISRMETSIGIVIQTCGLSFLRAFLWDYFLDFTKNLTGA